ncbi:hypothetical protein KVR01_009018 [Diaporthe batatas]|uniref:uncharacterized protein n=1 Tax=Diaporthe batatas TaxID=748121 RepID=UPI001D036254|nr:uncharacterized protein KVR01_009018 [Diaporthe batatas]KAG8160754.1 hypothetical protein KVR01_009018 [Diaporthe batatas]
MLDVAVAGNIFASPSAPQILAGIRALESPQGTLLITKNYTGDKLNFGLAAEQAKAEGRDVRVVFVGDDVSIKNNQLVGRRGLAGTIFVHKTAGAAAAQGMSLTEVTRIAQKTADSLATVAMSLDRCNVPQREGQDSECLSPGIVEYGMGIHNEPGAERAKIAPLEDMVAKLLTMLLEGLNGCTDCAAAVMVNNLGGLSVLELHIVADEILRQLSLTAIEIHRVFIGSYVTALDGPGVSLTLLKLDSELEKLIDAPTAVNAWPKSVSGYSKEGLDQQIVPDQGVAAIQPSGLPKLPFSRKLLISILLGVALQVKADEPLITKYDTIAGDGDCGETLMAGANGKLALLIYGQNTSSDDFDLAVAFREIASVIQETMGGTSGAIYAIFLNAVSTALENFAGPANRPPYSRVLADALAQGLGELCTYTSAKQGSRTIMDALIPFVKTLHQNPHDLRAAISAARTGAEGTRRMEAKLGRASYVTKEQFDSLKDGVPDPGAIGVVSVLEGIEAGLVVK